MPHQTGSRSSLRCLKQEHREKAVSPQAMRHSAQHNRHMLLPTCEKAVLSPQYPHRLRGLREILKLSKPEGVIGQSGC